MCRFLVYKGSEEILLSKLILDPTHSILKQSFDCRLRLDNGQNNADGFGIGFYTDPKLGPDPCLFTSTTPAWNCSNLQRIASKTASHLIFGHVRATTEGSLSEDNCHPFTHGSLMWMHNGGISGWKHVKRRLGERLADKWYLSVNGGTDSEWAFALFLDTLERLGYDPSAMPEKGFGPTVLRKAVLKTISQINEITDAIPESVIQAENVDTRSLLNFAVTDGHSVICTRYISSSTDEAASLYYSSGTQWETRTSRPGDRDYQMERQDKGADIVLVASEPLTFERENWVNVPTNSILTIHKQTVMVHPIIDQHYARSPYHVRSSAYVQTKGLISNEKRPTPSSTPDPLRSIRKTTPITAAAATAVTGTTTTTAPAHPSPLGGGQHHASPTPQQAFCPPIRGPTIPMAKVPQISTIAVTSAPASSPPSSTATVPRTQMHLVFPPPTTSPSSTVSSVIASAGPLPPPIPSPTSPTPKAKAKTATLATASSSTTSAIVTAPKSKPTTLTPTVAPTPTAKATSSTRPTAAATAAARATISIAPRTSSISSLSSVLPPTQPSSSSSHLSSSALSGSTTTPAQAPPTLPQLSFSPSTMSQPTAPSFPAVAALSDRRSVLSTPVATKPKAQGNIKVKRRSLGSLDVGTGGLFTLDSGGDAGRGATGSTVTLPAGGMSVGPPGEHGALGTLMPGEGGSGQGGQGEPMTPGTPETRPADTFGNPNKIAQFFPELRLS